VIAEGEAQFRSLALVNTRLIHAGQPADLLADPQAAGRWLGTTVTPGEAGQLRALRESIRALFEASAAGHAPPAGDLDTVNAVAAAAPITPTLTWDGTGPFRQDQHLSGNPAATAMAGLAEDAMNLVTSPAAATLHACGAHGCIRWYLRTHAARQWCSTRCGDRVRAARHYARHHPGDTVLVCC
jgi:predicted RNA-binding Zn ribbon-like protein